MFTLTDAAREHVAAMIAERGDPALALRVSIAGRRFGRFAYDLALIGPSERAEGDLVVQSAPFQVLVDPASAGKLEGAKLDYVVMGNMSGFAVENPNPLWDDPTALALQKLIDEEINPSLRMHGGIVSLVDVADGVAYVAFGGGCQGCGMVDVTLRDGIEVRIKDVVPEIVAVVDVTDHGGGRQPNAAPSTGEE